MLLSFSRALIVCHRVFFITIDRIDPKTLSLFIAPAVWIVRSARYIGKAKKRLHGRKTVQYKVLSVNYEHSSTADHLINTGHNMKWYHFKILAGGKTSKHCLIKRELTDKEHCPTSSDKNYGKKVGNPVGGYTILPILSPSHFMSPLLNINVEVMAHSHTNTPRKILNLLHGNF